MEVGLSVAKHESLKQALKIAVIWITPFFSCCCQPGVLNSDNFEISYQTSLGRALFRGRHICRVQIFMDHLILLKAGKWILNTLNILGSYHIQFLPISHQQLLLVVCVILDFSVLQLPSRAISQVCLLSAGLPAD